MDNLGENALPGVLHFLTEIEGDPSRIPSQAASAKVLIDTDSRVLVETPTYLGALQAFTPMEPTVVAVDSDNEGVLVDDLKAKVGTGAGKARFLYVLPNFQNPTGRAGPAGRNRSARRGS